MANPDLQIKGCPVIQAQTGIEISGGGGGLTKNFFGYLGLNLIKDRGRGGGGVDPPGPSTGSATAKPSENWLSN